MAKKNTTSRAGKKKSSAGAKASPGASESGATRPKATKTAKARAPVESSGRSADKAEGRKKAANDREPSAAAPEAKAPTGTTRAGRTKKAAGSPIQKAPSPTRPKGGNGQAADRPVKLRKTRLSAADLEEFRQLLIAKRRELVGDVSQLESQAMGQNGGGSGPSTSSMPIHMADLGSDTWEQELTLGLIENERGLLREIDEALDRIEGQTYGICLATNRPITKSRLRARPWAKYCIEYARKRELGLA